MWIESLHVNNCRLLENISIDLSKHLNQIVGKNASGKTSLLESLSFLSSGRSFRTSHISEVITHAKSSILVSAKINTDNSTSHIGIEKSQNKTRIRINQQDIYSQAELSSYLPITIIHPGSIELITGSPKIRRSYIDWITFYLFPDFHIKWRQYQHILKQRNLCLKDSKHYYAIDQWTEELIELQPIINEYRKKSIELLKPKLKKISEVILNSKKIELEFTSGFPNDIKLDTDSLRTYYKNKKEYDIKSNRTTGGIHRADLRVLMNSKPASQSASRGQLKLIAIALLLSQNETIMNSDKEKGVLLIDDLASELDKKNRKILLDYLSTLDKQLIITSTSEITSINIPGKVFHVKHGEIKEE